MSTWTADKKTDIVVLALPDGLARAYVDELESSLYSKLIIDLSADFRFDNDWIYSVPESGRLKQAVFSPENVIKVSNPGCYATAMQLAIAPVKDLLSSRPNCFGVSGYSGAGTKPSPNNDPQLLVDNLLPYTLVEHLHEKEVSYHLETNVTFTPHVAEFFRGINMTIQLEFKSPVTIDKLNHRFQNFYAEHSMVIYQSEIPTLKQVVNSPNCIIGGVSLSKDGKRATIISCIDNLLKGAASQAIQNINLVLGQNSVLGLTDLGLTALELTAYDKSKQTTASCNTLLNQENSCDSVEKLFRIEE